MTDTPEPTDEEIEAVLREHPIFGPAMRGEVTGYTVEGAPSNPSGIKVVTIRRTFTIP